MRRFRQGLLILICLYGLYLIKTALGIDISQRYTAWEVFKLPVKSLIHRSSG
ncbi:hypothetical protein [Trichocoleus sp. FACHB-262]|uniref:hypothetical protein n=1 Tax=Trichocoleus sp. FACHB-262 TaxID=2692869 RepID=UPI001687EC44|nr:hypothetical protein [Trichocoleus sp. FACHB-262]MBD2120142.1 hypothetical protein [Trichocoleus sp. FACHB-262]